jgi:glutamate 5-kinase
MQKVRRLVIKVGTNVVTKRDGDPNASWAGRFAAQIGRLRARGCEVIVVSSGSIGAGRHVLEMHRAPDTLAAKQAAAAVGQPRLMRIYKDAFRRAGIRVAQILLTYDDLDSRLRSRNATNTIDTLIGMDVVPIINENDTVAVEEIKFGDNDYLSALVCRYCRADLLVLLSDVDGVLKDGSKPMRETEVVAHISARTWRHDHVTYANVPNGRGTGGMPSKIAAALTAVDANAFAVITKGTAVDVLERILDGENIGTLVTR